MIGVLGQLEASRMSRLCDYRCIEPQRRHQGSTVVISPDIALHVVGVCAFGRSPCKHVVGICDTGPHV